MEEATPDGTASGILNTEILSSPYNNSSSSSATPDIILGAEEHTPNTEKDYSQNTLIGQILLMRLFPEGDEVGESFDDSYIEELSKSSLWIEPEELQLTPEEEALKNEKLKSINSAIETIKNDVATKCTDFSLGDLKNLKSRIYELEAAVHSSAEKKGIELDHSNSPSPMKMFPQLVEGMKEIGINFPKDGSHNKLNASNLLERLQETEKRLDGYRYTVLNAIKDLGGKDVIQSQINSNNPNSGEENSSSSGSNQNGGDIDMTLLEKFTGAVFRAKVKASNQIHESTLSRILSATESQFSGLLSGSRAKTSSNPNPYSPYKSAKPVPKVDAALWTSGEINHVGNPPGSPGDAQSEERNDNHKEKNEESKELVDGATSILNAEEDEAEAAEAVADDDDNESCLDELDENGVSIRHSQSNVKYIPDMDADTPLIKIDCISAKLYEQGLLEEKQREAQKMQEQRQQRLAELSGDTSPMSDSAGGGYGGVEGDRMARVRRLSQRWEQKATQQSNAAFNNAYNSAASSYTKEILPKTRERRSMSNSASPNSSPSAVSASDGAANSVFSYASTLTPPPIPSSYKIPLSLSVEEINSNQAHGDNDSVFSGATTPSVISTATSASSQYSTTENIIQYERERETAVIATIHINNSNTDNSDKNPGISRKVVTRKLEPKIKPLGQGDNDIDEDESNWSLVN